MTNNLIISSRVRLARNLDHKRFPHLLNTMEKQAISQKIRESINRHGELYKYYDSLRDKFDLEDIRPATQKQFFHELSLSEIKPAQIYSLIEQNLISKELAARADGSDLLFSPDFSLSIMLQEEDHLRIQAPIKGDKLLLALHRAQVVAKFIEQKLSLARDEQLGYLTACPSNVGTGLRASVMLRLTGLKMLKQLDPLSLKLAKVGYVLRGAHGENTAPEGNIFQLSQDRTLGQSDRLFVKRLLSTAEQLVEQEMRARRLLYRDNKLVVRDRIVRALGLIEYAELVTEEDLLNTLCWLDFATSILDDELGAKCSKLLPILESVRNKSGTYTLLHNHFPASQVIDDDDLESFLDEKKYHIQQIRANMIKQACN